jgi:tRNA (guanine-N7-)-methyltransferase
LSRSDGFDYPQTPDDTEFWKSHFNPEWLAKLNDTTTEVYADVGCGFGGLLMNLASLYPQSVSIGFEIRQKVTEYVKRRILHLRQEQEETGAYQNVSVLRANAMRYLPNLFQKGQLSKMFFCFPDPQFKKKNHRRRIISNGLLAEYAYLLRPGGRLYHITDVPELHEWMENHCKEHPCFRQIPTDELEEDPAVPCMRVSTEEGQKVARGGGNKYYCVYERIADEDAMKSHPLTVQ